VEFQLTEDENSPFREEEVWGGGRRGVILYTQGNLHHDGFSKRSPSFVMTSLSTKS